MLRRYVPPPIRPEHHGVDDDAVAFEPVPDWTPLRFAAELPRRREDDDEVGVRALLSRPEAQSRAWRATTERRRSPGRRHRGDRKRASRHHDV